MLANMKEQIKGKNHNHIAVEACDSGTLVVASWGKEKLMSSVVCSWSIVGEEIVPLAVLMSLSLDVAPLTACYLRAIVNEEEVFLGIFLDFYVRDLECRDITLNKSTILWWKFSAATDRSVDPHHKQQRGSEVCVSENKTQHKKERHARLLRGNPKREKHPRMGKRFHYNSQVIRIIDKLLVCLLS